MTRAQLDKRPADVSAMFDQVAERYDLLNDVLSAGPGPALAQGGGQRGRRRARRARARPGGRHRHLVPRLHRGRGALRGLRLLPRHAAGRRCGRPGRPAGVAFAAGDALALPFRDCAFDAVTISFGLRNVADPDAALAELLRVTRPGGRLVVCEFSHLPGRRADACYERYLARALPLSPGGCRATRRPTPTWPSRSGTGRTSGSWRGRSRRPAGGRCAGGTSASAWPPCTPPGRPAGE